MTLITYVTRVHFADGIVEDALKVELEAGGIAKPLVMTDAGLSETDLVDRLSAALPQAPSPVFYTRSAGDPTEREARAAAAVFKAEGCDGLIAFGGGCTIDLAKAARVLIRHNLPLAQFSAAEGGGGRIGRQLVTLIAVPTTAGSGSEVGPDAAIVMEDGRKRALVSRHLIPTSAICDPTLTVSMPRAVTAGTGMDALSHCIETYLAASYNPPADGIALDGMGRAARYLERACDRGTDLEARREMMAASLNGALAFQKGLGATHAISHALSALPGFSLHHGTVNAILLPHVLAFNAPAVGDRMDAVKVSLGVANGTDLPDAISKLAARISIPKGLGALGLTERDIDRAAPMAEGERHNGTNPRRARAGDYARMMRAAL
ncbi:MAG: iron-containing alcohol dehydrogenase [Pseudomonadota bacterium]